MRMQSGPHSIPCSSESVQKATPAVATATANRNKGCQAASSQVKWSMGDDPPSLPPSLRFHMRRLQESVQAARFGRVDRICPRSSKEVSHAIIHHWECHLTSLDVKRQRDNYEERQLPLAMIQPRGIDCITPQGQSHSGPTVLIMNPWIFLQKIICPF
ncbi:hypothetical protein SKAU_G00184040 [Synaphobranchus kaupii]|uniref:Uncharacterized protein n=1 Tax=Synaphobranchus kaupii TaxID=118154 RepID=A0A9Q1FCN6_SYNKA|nr:hypothetical protein SKAU_G00184040 [Synaphobranchus kaupii]